MKLEKVEIGEVLVTVADPMTLQPVVLSFPKKTIIRPIIDNGDETELAEVLPS